MLGSARERGAAGRGAHAGGPARACPDFIVVYEAGVRLQVTLRLAIGAVRPRGATGGGEAGAGVVGEKIGPLRHIRGQLIYPVHTSAEIHQSPAFPSYGRGGASERGSLDKELADLHRYYHFFAR